MPATELDLMLGAAAWRLQAGADDPALTPDALREMARDGAMLLQQLRPELAAMRLALARAQAAERRALRRAECDSLTALPNRDSFDSRLHGALGASEQPARMLAVLFLDLDRFKHVNDHHGHAVGDALLRVVAKRLRRGVRATDTVCRLGGDEFACLVSGPLGRDEVGRMAAKLIAAVSAPLRLGQLALSVRPSIGIAMCPTDGDNAAALLQRADAAMFRAKRQQCGLAFFDASTDKLGRLPSAAMVGASGGRLGGR